MCEWLLWRDNPLLDLLETLNENHKLDFLEDSITLQARVRTSPSSGKFLQLQ